MNVIDQKKMMEAVKAGDGSALVMYTSLLSSLDPMKGMQNIDWTKSISSHGIVYIPGKEKWIN